MGILKFFVAGKRLVARSIYITPALVLLSGLSINTLNISAIDAQPDDLPQAHKAVIADQSEVLNDEILLKLKAPARPGISENPAPTKTGRASLDALNGAVGATKFEPVVKKSKDGTSDSEIFGWYNVKLAKNSQKKVTRAQDPDAVGQLEKAIKSYANNPDVEAVEPVFVAKANAVPNDPYYSSNGLFAGYDDMWGMKKINAAGAWDHSTGSANIVIASIDSGVDRGRSDLAANMWVNTADPVDGADNDANGYIDDYYGWDFANNDNNPNDDFGHGTMTAGIMGAVGNNGVEVVGVNWQTSIMALKFLNNQGSGTSANVVKALVYAANKGAKVSNNSYGVLGYSRAIDDAVKYEHDRGMVIVTSAGNGNGADALGQMPAAARDAIVVSSTDPSDQLASDSNRGPKIDVAAPGVSILSVTSDVSPLCNRPSGGGYGILCWKSGTSFAAPHVAGLAAQLMARFPDYANQPETIRQLLRVGSRDLSPVGRDNNFGFGRIDANSEAYNNFQPLAPYISNLRTTDAILPGQANQRIMGGTPGPNFKNYKLETGKGRNPTSWTAVPVPNATRQVNNGLLGTIDATKYDGGLYTIRLTATGLFGSTELSIFDVKIGQVSTVNQAPKVTITAPAAGATVSGIVTVRATLTDDKGVASGRLYVDGVLVVIDSTAPYTFAWDTKKVANGNHTIKVQATDTDGKVASSSITVKVAN